MTRFGHGGITIFLFSTHLVFALAMPSPQGRRITGTVVDPKGQVLKDVTVIAARSNGGEQRVTTNEVGQFTVNVPDEDTALRVEGQYVQPQEPPLSVPRGTESVRI